MKRKDIINITEFFIFTILHVTIHSRGRGKLLDRLDGGAQNSGAWICSVVDLHIPRYGHDILVYL